MNAAVGAIGQAGDGLPALGPIGVVQQVQQGLFPFAAYNHIQLRHGRQGCFGAEGHMRSTHDRQNVGGDPLHVTDESKRGLGTHGNGGSAHHVRLERFKHIGYGAWGLR